jgi:hypothetical protein
MGLLVWAVTTLMRGLGHAGLGAQLAQVLVPVIVGVTSYIALATALGVREMGAVRSLLARRFGPTKS